MDVRLPTLLSIGTLLMIIVMVICRKWRHTPLWKTIVVPFLLMVAGVAGVRLLFYIENGSFDGTSFYGAVLFVPIMFVIVKLVFFMPYGQLMDLCAPSECIMLAVMKVQCIVNGCCWGRILCINAAGEEIRFPSQIVEMAVALILVVVLILMMRNPKNHGKIYPFYMILYGSSRFVLNLLRETTDFIWILPAGNVWSIVSIAAGLLWLYILKKSRDRLAD